MREQNNPEATAEMVHEHRWSGRALMNELAFVVDYISLYVVVGARTGTKHFVRRPQHALCAYRSPRAPRVSCLTTIDLHHYRFLSYFELLETCKGVWPVAKYVCTCVCH